MGTHHIVDADLPADPARGRLRVEALLTGGIVLAVVVLGWLRRWTSDDAYINFRVVENLLAGNGPVYSAPERVEVATSPLWLLVLTAAEAVVPGENVAWAAVFFGLVLTAVGVLFAMLAARRLFAHASALLVVPFGAVVFAALPPAWDFTTSGLETGLSFAWIGVSFWGLVRWLRNGSPAAGRPLWLYLLLGVGPLVRPDFAIIAGALLLWLTVVGTGRWWQRARGLVVAGILPVGYQVFRMGYYGLLIPNTAVAKESGRPLWERGFVYLTDLVAPHLLWVPALLALVLLALVLPRTGWRAREWSLFAVVLAAAAVHALYVVRVGGDFMHARLLMPSLFLALCPVAAVPVLPALRWANAAVLAAAAVWVVASVAVLRTDYEGGIGASGIADERGFYTALAGVENPVTMADHGRTGLSAYSARITRLHRAGADLVIGQPGPVTPETPAIVLAGSDGGVTFFVANAGFYGVGSGLDVFVVDRSGLTDPVAGHMEPPPPGRPGHEKEYHLWWLLARYGAPELTEPGTQGPAEPDLVAASREALSCGAVAELVAATNDPLTWNRFWANLTGSVERTSMRIPVDPFVAVEQYC